MTFIFSLVINFTKRFLKIAIPLVMSNWVLGFFKPYAQSLVYHVLVGFRIFTSPFLHGDTAMYIAYMFSIYYFARFVRFIINKI